jgi:cell division protease FtsH
VLNDWAKQILLWLVILVVLLSVFQSLSQGNGGRDELAYSEFLAEVRNDGVAKVTISEDGSTISGERKGGDKFTTIAPVRDFGMFADLIKHKVEIVQKPVPKDSIVLSFLLNALPFLLFIGVAFYFMRQMQGPAAAAVAR